MYINNIKNTQQQREKIRALNISAKATDIHGNKSDIKPTKRSQQANEREKIMPQNQKCE